MPENPNSSSFIPKRSTGPRVRQRRTHTFFFISILSYACLVAAPTSAAAVYVYSLYTDKQFNEAVTNLDVAISDFREADMASVLEFDARIKAATALIDNHVSLVRALEVFEQSTLQSVGFSDLKFLRTSPNTIEASASLTTVNLDAALFQRTEYSKESVSFDKAILDSVTFVPPNEDGFGESVTMNGKFTFTKDSIEFDPQMVNVPATSSSESVVDVGVSDSEIDNTGFLTDGADVSNTSADSISE